MSVFEFITVLLSIVVGLGITRILSGFGRVIELDKGIKPFWVQIIWMANIGLFFIAFWWMVVFSYHGITEWTFIDFSFLFFYAVLLYLQSVLISPGNIIKGVDFRAHFFKVQKWFFILGAVVALVDGLDTVRHGIKTLISYGFWYSAFILVGIIGNLFASQTKSYWFHYFWAVWCFGWMVGWILWRSWMIK